MQFASKVICALCREGIEAQPVTPSYTPVPAPTAARQGEHFPRSDARAGLGCYRCLGETREWSSIMSTIDPTAPSGREASGRHRSARIVRPRIDEPAQ